MKLEKEDKVITEFLDSIGPWRNYVIIGGGYALIVYKLYLADRRLENPPVGTRDIDTLISRRVPQISEKSIAKHLEEAGFAHVHKDINVPAAEAYVKEINGAEVEIEFLTDSAVRNNKNKNVVIAGVVAQPLRYLTLSLQTTQKFQTHLKQTGLVVSPGAWIFHKGLTFTRRKTPAKLQKDLYGIWYVASQLGDVSEQAIAEFNILATQHPKWWTTFQKNLLYWLENASPSERVILEMQDPSGKLQWLHFKRIMEKLLNFSRAAYPSK